jgi:hypothetical protein
MRKITSSPYKSLLAMLQTFIIFLKFDDILQKLSSNQKSNFQNKKKLPNFKERKALV